VQTKYKAVESNINKATHNYGIPINVLKYFYFEKCIAIYRKVERSGLPNPTACFMLSIHVHVYSTFNYYEQMLWLKQMFIEIFFLHPEQNSTNSSKITKYISIT
jgi:hypothetical protein